MFFLVSHIKQDGGDGQFMLPSFLIRPENIWGFVIWFDSILDGENRWNTLVSAVVWWSLIVESDSHHLFKAYEVSGETAASQWAVMLFWKHFGVFKKARDRDYGQSVVKPTGGSKVRFLPYARNLIFNRGSFWRTGMGDEVLLDWFDSFPRFQVKKKNYFFFLYWTSTGPVRVPVTLMMRREDGKYRE